MDELKHGQLDTGSWSGRSAISGINVYIEIFNTNAILGGQEFA